MKTLKLIMALGVAALVSACGDTQTTTRNAGFETGHVPQVTSDPNAPGFMSLREIEQQEKVATLGSQSLVRVDQITIVVPETLTVSEKNSYLPKGDIVWRGDMIGNRHQQVKSIFEQGFADGTDAMDGARGVTLYVQVMRFHAISEKARYSIGGVHDITFGIAVRDAATGQFLSEPKVVNADLEAFGGQEAIQADARGETQKARITSHLAEVIRQELTKPGGFVNPSLGIIQSMNSQS